MKKMTFGEVINRYDLKIKGIARKFSYIREYSDEDDLAQEMRLYLWEQYQSGRIEGNTDSYILQGCWFHVRNYLRVADNKVRVTSLDEPVNETESEDMTLKDVIEDTARPLYDVLNWRMIYESINNNGLTIREKDVFRLRMQGYTMREAGGILHISGKRVFKLQDNIRRKWENKIFPGG